jgi:hypothetical protein
MVWQRKVIDLSEKEDRLNIQFIRRFCSIAPESHFQRDIHLRSTVIGMANRRFPANLEDFLQHYAEGGLEIDFGFPKDNITLFSTYDKGTIRFQLLDIAPIIYEPQILDAYFCCYGEMPTGYTSRF